MTTYYGRTAGGNWNSAATWSLSSGGPADGAVPTSSDDVFLDANSGAIAIINGSVCRDLDCTGYTSTLSATISVTFTCYGNFKLVSGMGFSYSASSTIVFAATSTGKTITSANKVMPNLQFNSSSGGWTLVGNFTPSDNTGRTITFAAGSVDLNGQIFGTSSAGWVWSATGTNTSSITFGAATCYIASSGGGVNFSGTAMTISAGSETWNNPSSGSLNFNPGGYTFGNISWGGILNANINGSGTFSNITISFSSVNESQFISIGGNITVTGNLSITGIANSARRVILRSSVNGTSRTITVGGTITATWLDFKDITGAGAASWNLSAVTGGSGDCGNNSGITFTTAINCYWVNNAGSWSTASKWSTTSGGATTARTPLPQDTAIFDANSFTTTAQTVTTDIVRLGPIDWTGVTNNPAWAKAATAGYQLFGDIVMVSGMTNSGTPAMTVITKNGLNITCGGQTLTNTITVSMPSGSTFKTIDKFMSSGALNASITGEILDFNNQDLSCTGCSWAGVTANNLGATWTISGAFQFQNGATINGSNCNVTCTAYSQVTGITSVSLASINASGAVSMTSSGCSLTVSGTITSGTTPSLTNGTITCGGFLTTANMTIAGITLNIGTGGGTCAVFSQTSGTVTIGSALPLVCSSTWAITGGTFTDNGGGVTATTISGTGSTARTITMGGTWTATATTGTLWNFATTTNLTLTRNSSTITFTDTGASAKTFAGGGLTYGTLSLGGASGNGAVTITGANRFTRINMVPYTSVIFTSSTTTTIDNAPMWVGASGQNIVITATGVAAATISTSGTPACDWMTLSKSTITGPAISYAGANSTNGGTNTGWTFSAAPNIFNDSITETVSATDSFGAAFNFNTTMTETAAATDTLLPGFIFGASITESVAAGDTLSVSATFRPSITESAAATDSMTAGNIISRSITETAVAGDSMIGLVSYDYFFTETVTATDNVIGGLLFNVAIEETVAATDSVTANKTIDESFTEQVEALDTDAVDANFETTIIETVAATDTIVGGIVQTEAFTETAVAGDSMEATKSYDYFITETVTASDLMQAQANFNASFLSIAAASDNMAVRGPKTTPDANISGIVLDLILVNGVW